MRVRVDVGTKKPVVLGLSTGASYHLRVEVLQILATAQGGLYTTGIMELMSEERRKDPNQEPRVRAAMDFLHNGRGRPLFVDDISPVYDRRCLWTITEAGRLALEDLKRQELIE